MTVRKINKVLISQPEPANGKSPYFDLGEKYNVEISFRPFIKVEGVSLKEFRHQRINILDYTAVVMTSRTAIDHFFTLCEELKIIVPDTMKYFCISEAIALYLQKYIVYRKRRIFFSQTGKIEGLDASFTKHSKEKVLIPVPEEHSDDIQNLLTSKKIDSTTSVMYRTVSNDYEEGETLDADMILFFSPLGVSSLLKNFPDFEQGDIGIGCFGAGTAKTLEENNLRVDCLAPQPQYPSMTMALEAFLKENQEHHA